MSEEEAIRICKKIIQQNNEIVKQTRKNNDINAMQLTANCDTESLAIETLIAELEKKDKEIYSIQSKLDEANSEIVKLNKAMYEMSECLLDYDFCYKEEACENCWTSCEECIKQYFERKIENEI